MLVNAWAGQGHPAVERLDLLQTAGRPGDDAEHRRRRPAPGSVDRGANPRPAIDPHTSCALAQRAPIGPYRKTDTAVPLERGERDRPLHPGCGEYRAAAAARPEPPCGAGRLGRAAR